MIKKLRNRCGVLCATSALLAVAALPATASADSCATPYFSAPFNIYLGLEGPDTRISSTDVTVYAYCGSPDNPLANVLVTGVSVTGLPALQLEGSANGDVPNIPLPAGFPTAPANLTTISAANPQGLTTDATGHVTFKLRVQSLDPSISQLALPSGAPRFVGLYLSFGYNEPPGAPFDPSNPDAFAGGKVWAATPELDSILLFGTGAAGMAGYALTRMRARRRD